MGQYSVLDSRDIIGSFYKKYTETVDGSWATQLATLINTNKESETYRWLGGAPPVREWLGPRHEQALGRYTMSITNKKYEATLRIDVDDLRRDKTGQLQVRVAEMARKAAMHPEVLLSTLIINGDTTTSGLCYDGQQFFDTDHSEGDSGTQTNDLTATEIPSANVSTATAPTASEMANILLECVGYQYGYKDDKGDNINGDARNFVVMVGTASLYSAAAQAIGLNALASGADNPLRALSGVTITPIFNPRLSALTSQIEFFRADGDVRPFIHQVEVPLTTQLIGAGSELEFEEDAHKFGVKVVRGVGYGMWQHAMEVTLS